LKRERLGHSKTAGRPRPKLEKRSCPENQRRKKGENTSDQKNNKRKREGEGPLKNAGNPKTVLKPRVPKNRLCKKPQEGEKEAKKKTRAG